MEQVGIAVIGAGYWGPNLVRNFTADDGCTVRWVCDLDGDRAAKLANRFGVARSTTSLDDVLADPHVHGVAIATPVETHAPLVRAAFAAGKDVLVEKPLAESLEVGRALVDEAEAAGRILMVDHTFCFTSTVQKIHELIDSGDLGGFQYYDSVRVNLGLVQTDVDVMWDLAPHDLSILDYILPEGVTPVSVSAVGSDPLGVGRACVAYLTVHLSNGALAHMHLNWLSPVKVRSIMIGGTERMLVWDDTKPTQRLSIFDAGADLRDADAPHQREALISYRIGDMVAPALPEVEALAGVAAAFCESIVTRKAPETDGWAGLRVLAMLDAASKSLDDEGRAYPVSSLATAR